MRVQLETLKATVAKIENDGLKNLYTRRLKGLTRKVENIEAGNYDTKHHDDIQSATNHLTKLLEEVNKEAIFANQLMTVEVSGASQQTLAVEGLCFTFDKPTGDTLNLLAVKTDKFSLAFYPDNAFDVWTQDAVQILAILALRFSVAKILIGKTVYDALNEEIIPGASTDQEFLNRAAKLSEGQDGWGWKKFYVDREVEKAQASGDPSVVSVQ